MPLLDNNAAEKMKAERDLAIAHALATPAVKSALDVLIENGIEPGIAHGCMMHLRRQILKQPQGK